MNQAVNQAVVEQVHVLLPAPSCCQQAREAAQRFLDAIDTPQERQQTEAFLAELEADRMPVQMLIDFAQSEQGAKVFGEKAADVAAHAKQIQAAGAQFCDCAACSAATKILEQRAQLLP